MAKRPPPASVAIILAAESASATAHGWSRQKNVEIVAAGFTLVASLLLNDYVVFAVNADLPMETGKDLADRLKKAVVRM